MRHWGRDLIRAVEEGAPAPAWEDRRPDLTAWSAPHPAALLAALETARRLGTPPRLYRVGSAALLRVGDGCVVEGRVLYASGFAGGAAVRGQVLPGCPLPAGAAPVGESEIAGLHATRRRLRRVRGAVGGLGAVLSVLLLAAGGWSTPGAIWLCGLGLGLTALLQGAAARRTLKA